MIVRGFEDPNIVHVEHHPDPVRDIEIVNVELALADMSTVEKRLEKSRQRAKADPKLAEEVAALERLREALNEGKPARSFARDELTMRLAKELSLLTAKPLLYVANVDEASLKSDSPQVAAVEAKAQSDGAECVVVCAKLEAEIAALPPGERAAYAKELGVEQSGLDRLIIGTYRLLNLMTFLTAGEKQARAWTITRGTKAPQAAGTIHSDMERGFIRAEIAAYDDFARLRSVAAVREAGLLRSEGRDYVMREGDVVLFKFNV
jgi:GTP-binding protein YchF